jgi:ribonuclease E
MVTYANYAIFDDDEEVIADSETYLDYHDFAEEGWGGQGGDTDDDDSDDSDDNDDDDEAVEQFIDDTVMEFFDPDAHDLEFFESESAPIDDDDNDGDGDDDGDDGDDDDAMVYDSFRLEPAA